MCIQDPEEGKTSKKKLEGLRYKSRRKGAPSVRGHRAPEEGGGGEAFPPSLNSKGKNPVLFYSKGGVLSRLRKK